MTALSRHTRSTAPHRRRLVGAVATAGMILAIVPVAAAQASDASIAPLHLAAADAAVAGSYIVVLDQSSTTADVDSVQRLAVSAGATIDHTFSAALAGFSGQLSSAALAAVRAADGVAYVEQDVMASLDDTVVSGSDGSQQGATWGIDRVDQRKLPLNQTYKWTHDGSGVTAYIIDTGIRITHTEFEGRASYGWDFYDDDAIADDCHGHGTHVAGTTGGKTYGIAKGVSLVALRTISCSGNGVVSDSIAAIDWVVQKATTRAVMNMSLHFGKVQALNDAIAAAFAKDIMFSAAAANDSQDACNDSPSSEPTALTVAASDKNDAKAYFSNYGPCVDLFAPGVDILSAGISSDTATATMSGTSMAAPHVTGGLALVLDKKPTANGTKITKVFLKKTTKNTITNPGAGTPNKLLFTKKF